MAGSDIHFLSRKREGTDFPRTRKTGHKKNIARARGDLTSKNTLPMAGRFNMAFLAALMVAAALSQSSSAQTTYTVGDTLGWVVPPGGSVAYTTWAANKSFTVGDILVFTFTSGAHDVAQVTKADYDACSTSNPLVLQTSGPARITLNTTGENYFICNFTGHCSLGQKLMINVSAASSSPAPQPSSSSPAPRPSASTPVSAPAPQPVSPSTPAPASAPAPGSSRSPVTYTVGDSLGWVVPSANAIAYQTWAANKTFMVGDILVFNYASGVHDVAEVTSSAYASCSGTNPISTSTTPPTRITLTTSGEHFYICTFPGHCSSGQKLAINVTGSATATPQSSPTPSTTPSPPSPTTPSSPSPTGSATPPSPGNSATSLGVASLSVTFLSILFAFLY